MNFIKRAWFAVIRKPARTVIMLVIFLVIANLVLTGLSIQHATNVAETAARKQLGATLTLSYDTEKALEQARSEAEASGSNSGSRFRSFNITREPITEAMADAVAKQKDVISYNIIVNTYAMAENFDPVVTTGTSSSSTTTSSKASSSKASASSAAKASSAVTTISSQKTASKVSSSSKIASSKTETQTSSPNENSQNRTSSAAASSQAAVQTTASAASGTGTDSAVSGTGSAVSGTESAASSAVSQNNNENSRGTKTNSENTNYGKNDGNNYGNDQNATPPEDYGNNNGGNTTTSRSGSYSGRENNGGGGGMFTVMFGQGMTIPDVTIVGVSSTALYADFNDGTSTLVSGRNITPSDKGKKVVVIEQNLATQNNLKVGSTVIMTAPNSSTQVKYTVVGIYKTSSTSSQNGTGGGMRNMTYSEPYNYIYTDYQSALDIKTAISAATSTSSSSSTSSTVQTSSVSSYATSSTTSTGRVVSRGGSFGITSPGIDSVVYYLDDPKNMDKAISDIKKISSIDWNKFTITSDDSEYEQMVGTIQNVASTSKMIVLLVGIVGAVILALIMLLNVRERMYETGVMLSMGESKLKLLSQFAAEMVMIAAVAFIISAFTGQYISKSLTNYLVQTQINSVTSSASTQNGGYAYGGGGGEGGQNGGADQNGGGQNFGGGARNNYLNRLRYGNTASVKQITSLSVSISWYEFGGLCLAGLIIILLATIIPAISIMRFKPKDILTRAG